MEDSENGTTSKSKGPPQEDFPWPHFASLAMHNLMNHWELQPTTKVVSEETSIKPTPKVNTLIFYSMLYIIRITLVKL